MVYCCMRSRSALKTSDLPPLEKGFRNGLPTPGKSELPCSGASRRRSVFQWSVTCLIFLVVLFSVRSTQAIIFYSTAEPEHNTTAPVGELAQSGWELQGLWGSFLGTPIAPQFFITARHVGGAVGNKFYLGPVEYTTVAYFDDPKSDLRIWKIRGRFTAFSALYTRNDEVGKNLIVHGRGTQRGEEVTVAGFFAQERKGWLWGTPDGRNRWGENQVNVITSNDPASNPSSSDNSSVRNLLKITFDAAGGPNEAHLSEGDSGGGLFIKDGAAWRLAGINLAVDGPYNTVNTGAGFRAAIYDEGGLYKGGEGKWSQSPDILRRVPGAFYASRISTSVDWINSVLAQASSDALPTVESSPVLSGPYTGEPLVSIDETVQTISLMTPNGSRFYRLSGPTGFRFAGIIIKDGQLVLTYE